MRAIWSLLVFLLGVTVTALGEDGALAASDAVMVTAVTAIVIGGFILYEYVRGRGTR